MRRVRHAAVIAALVCAALVAAPAASVEARQGVVGRNWPSERAPRPLPAHEVAFPPYAVKTLANGLQVIAVPHHEQPAVSLRLLVRAGSAQDPAAHPGVAAMVATLLDQGTTTRSAEQVANAIDSIGGALATGAGPDLSFINCVVMKDSLSVGLDLVSELAQHPAFADEELERQRQQALSGMRVSNDDPEFLANIVFDRLVYGFHPYGRPQTGTPEAVAALTRQDLIEFHQKWFGANNAILAIVGDVTADEAFAGAARAFGRWTRIDAVPGTPIEPPAPTRRLVVVDKPGAVQTEIRVGNIAIARKSDDFMALDLATKILGGEGANRLHRVLRTERGLTYGASADFNALKQTGEIVAQTNTRSSTTGETLRLIVDEVWKLLRDRVGARELAGAQEYQTGSFPLTIETPSQIALQVLNAAFFGLDMRDLETYRDRVSAVTVDDIQRVARQYLHPDRLTIVLVGDASSFVGQLAGAGFDKFEIVPAADLDLSAPDLRRKAAPPSRGYRPASLVTTVASTAPRPAQSPRAKALLDKVIAAKGGLATLKGVKTVRSTGTMIADSAGGPVPFPVVYSIDYPDKFRLDAEMPGGRVSQVYAAGRFWIVGPDGGVDEMPEEGRAPIRATIQRDTIPMLVKAAAGALVVREVDADEPTQDALEISGPDMSPVTLFINRDNGLIERSRYESPEGRAEERYDDYRDVEGIQVPFHTVLRRPGLTSIVRDVKTIHFNVALPADLFVTPKK